MPFAALPEGQALEAEVRARWDAQDVPARSLRLRQGAPSFVFYEGPPTANGKPGLHHVFSRTLKDAICRHRQMTGHHVPRRAGWDTQGLPVEIEVQKQLGISTRDEIETLGIAEFNRLCRESVFAYKAEWEALSARMAFWLDYEDAYVTCESDYIQSCWAILSRFHAAGLLARDFKVLPYCPRCSTGLSNHEVAQGYRDVQDPSVFVRFGIAEAAWEACLGSPAPGTGPLSMLVWTTTPWTLFSNVAVAAHPELEYLLLQAGDERLLLAGPRAEAVLGEDAGEVLARFPGARLEGLAYQRPLDAVEVDGAAPAFSVRLAGYVSAEDGTGLVHTAPAFGVDDFSLRAAEGLPIPQPVDDQGCFTEAVAGFAGRFVKEADRDIVRLLKERGLLYRQATVQHSYPHCWRCRSPLLYMARPCWYLRTTQLRDRLVELNETIRWQPPEIGRGRFGEWLAGNVDWAISRERYWGTPLNVWVCQGCGAEKAPASLEELGLPEDFDPHRPAIDDVTLPCQACGKVMRRTPEVIDCWFDSGAMPFAQAGWPRRTGGKLPEQFPADFISEGVDQTRGWFYTLHVIATFLADQPAYRSCLVNDMVLDAQGKKMSKSVGNVVDPMRLFDELGADAVRWFFASSGQVWLPKRFDENALAESSRRTFGTLRNCYAFLALYANLDGFGPGDAAPELAQRPSIDRWLVSRTGSLTQAVGDAYQRLQLTEAARLLEVFIDEELSNWYVRRNRARFWKSGDDADKRAAFATLAHALERVALALAPLAPFLADGLWCAVTGALPEGSVHLGDWPEPEQDSRDPALEDDMAVVLAAVDLGRSVRAAHDLKLRQPLSACLIKAARPADAARLARADLARLVAEELNVRAVQVLEQADFRTLSAKPDFQRLGPRLGRRMKAVAAAVRGLDEAALEAFEAAGRMTLQVEGEAFELDREDVLLAEHGREGYAVAGDGRLVLALDTRLDDDLLMEGRAREIVNRVQNTRKRSGLAVSDRVQVSLGGSADLLAAAERHRELILGEVLGTRLTLVTDGPLPDGQAFDVEGAELLVAVERV